MLDFWKGLGVQMTQEELIAYSENGPIRTILLDQLEDLKTSCYKPTSKLIEIGGMLQPFAFEMCNRYPKIITYIQLIDPIYSVQKIPDKNIPNNIFLETFPEGVESLLHLFNNELESTLILENVINYLPLDIVGNIIKSPMISSVIIGNRSNASWGEFNHEKASHEQLLEELFAQEYRWVSEPFITDTAIAGILCR